MLVSKTVVFSFKAILDVPPDISCVKTLNKVVRSRLKLLFCANVLMTAVGMKNHLIYP